MVATFGTIALALLAGVTQISASPILESRSISTLSASQVASYKRYTYFAGAAYCKPTNTLAWNCGSNCNFNTGFKPIASGGDGSIVQYWYVGYDPTTANVIVGFQGTDASKILPVVTDLDFFLDELDATLFPGVSTSIKTHNGFGNAHAKSANAVLAAVKKGFSTYGTTKVTVVGHSLGAAIAIISTGHLSLHLPAGTTIRTISYSSPRVGNVEFANWVNARADMVRINNQDDIIPIVPGRFLGFAHTEGEIHIVDSNAWISCPGQDNTDSQCTIGYVPNILAGDTGDHSGPFDGVNIGC
ncbi:alpha/beta-hydrolase [Pholiota conissans]|uniref:Alpha/beta-hydrolase n=1 Tax=Pholiota conissans TaxID=109636 RepID=A0A9P5ZFN9_9AGAR|nr:alpha/beta-hydrolase [Pholiota conissans]